MELKLTDKAINWFKDEFELPQEGQAIHIFVRYGGEPQIKQGFSPAFNIDNRNDQPIEIGFEQDYDGVNIIIAEKDLWYFEDVSLTLDVDDKDEITFKF
ncbi:HesB/YadR/YfhF family protein [Staphylococcus simulans]